jgi:hypothetical protein
LEETTRAQNDFSRSKRISPAQNDFHALKVIFDALNQNFIRSRRFFTRSKRFSRAQSNFSSAGRNFHPLNVIFTRPTRFFNRSFPLLVYRSPLLTPLEKKFYKSEKNLENRRLYYSLCVSDK